MDPTVRMPRDPRTRGASWKRLEAQTTIGRKGAHGVDSQRGKTGRASSHLGENCFPLTPS